MQKGLIGILGVLVLFLAALNIRLSHRADLLEERVATAGRRSLPVTVPRPAAEPLVPAESSAASPAPVVKPAESRPVPPQATAGGTPPRKTARTEESRLLERVQALELAHESAARGLHPVQPPAPDSESSAGPRSGFLGISGVDVPGGGVMIQAVIPDSVALRSGLQPDDVILEYNGEPIDTLATLTSRVRSGGEGSPVSLRLRRNGVEFYQGVQLGARTPAQR